LTPQFFETKALDLVFGHQIEAEDLNRHRLGRTLDRIHQYGCKLLFSQISSHICQKIKLDQTFASLDTTTFSLSDEYRIDTDEHEIKINHGYSKDHRPDLKQVMLELITSQDGGIPLMMKCLDGNASDNKVLQERSRVLMIAFKTSQEPGYLVGNSKLYHKRLFIIFGDKFSKKQELPFVNLFLASFHSSSISAGIFLTSHNFALLPNV